MKVYQDVVAIQSQILQGIKKYKPRLLEKIDITFELDIDDLDIVYNNKLINGSLFDFWRFLKINYKHSQNDLLKAYTKKAIEIRKKFPAVKEALKNNEQSKFIFNFFEKTFTGFIYHHQDFSDLLFNYIVLNVNSYSTGYELSFYNYRIPSVKILIEKIEDFVNKVWFILENFDLKKEIENLDRAFDSLLTLAETRNLKDFNSEINTTIINILESYDAEVECAINIAKINIKKFNEFFKGLGSTIFTREEISLRHGEPRYTPKSTYIIFFITDFEALPESFKKEIDRIKFSSLKKRHFLSRIENVLEYEKVYPILISLKRNLKKVSKLSKKF